MGEPQRIKSDQVEQRIESDQAETGQLFADPAPRPQEGEWSERQTTHGPVVSAQDAREGATGHNVRYVLGFGVAAVVIAFIAIYLVYFA